MAALVGAAVVGVCFSAAADGKKHPAEEKGLKSHDGDVETVITFVNKSGKSVKVYWLDYEGERKEYATVTDGDKYEQQTFLTHPWLITDEKDNAWYVYFPDAQPRTVEIIAPKDK
jgi:hypothetical protein